MKWRGTVINIYTVYGVYAVYLHSVVDLRRHLCIGSALQAELRGGVSVQSTGQSNLQQQTHTPDTHTHKSAQWNGT